jgi:hypothetical protein
VLIHDAGAVHPGLGTDTAGTELTIVGQVVAPFLLTACRCPRWSGLSKPLSGSGPGGGSGRAGRFRVPVPGRAVGCPRSRRRGASAFTAATEYSRPRRLGRR